MFKGFWVPRRRPSLGLQWRSKSATKSSKNKNTLSTSLMESLATSSLKTNNIKMPNLNFSRQMSTNMFNQKIINWNALSSKLSLTNLSKTKSLLPTRSTGWSNTPSKWWETRLISNLKLMLLTSTWLTLITKTTASRRSSKVSFKLMSRLDKALTESNRLIKLDQRLTMLSRDPSKRLSRELLPTSNNFRDTLLLDKRRRLEPKEWSLIDPLLPNSNSDHPNKREPLQVVLSNKTWDDPTTLSSLTKQDNQTLARRQVNTNSAELLPVSKTTEWNLRIMCRQLDMLWSRELPTGQSTNKPNTLETPDTLLNTVGRIMAQERRDTPHSERREPKSPITTIERVTSRRSKRIIRRKMTRRRFNSLTKNRLLKRSELYQTMFTYN